MNYTLHGKDYNESHFSYQPLINAFKTYIANYSVVTGERSVEYWCKEVGNEQTKLTIEGRNQYCHLGSSFCPTPDFNEEHLERNLKFHNYVIKKDQMWDAGLKGLGVDFGIYRGSLPGPASGGRYAGLPVDYDIKAISRLSEVRTEDLKALKERLVQSIEKSEEIQKSGQMMLYPQ